MVDVKGRGVVALNWLGRSIVLLGVESGEREGERVGAGSLTLPAFQP